MSSCYDWIKLRLFSFMHLSLWQHFWRYQICIFLLSILISKHCFHILSGCFTKPENAFFSPCIRTSVCESKNVNVSLYVFLSLYVYIKYTIRGLISKWSENYFMRRLTHYSPSCRLQIASEVCQNMTEIQRVSERENMVWLDEISVRGYVP